MTDEPKPETDMKEEKKKIAETKVSEDKIVNKKREVEQKSDEKPTKDARDVKSSITKPKKSELTGEVKDEKKKPIQKTPEVKKTEATVKGVSLQISTKDAAAICRFIKNKKIQKAIEELEEVLSQKRAIPMKGEIPHRKGKMMSGRYPKKATENFIKLLNSLQANANNHNVKEPVISEAVANIASRPYARFGRWRRKRTHVRIVAREQKIIKKRGGREDESKSKIFIH